jgi:hypothetical protein
VKDVTYLYNAVVFNKCWQLCSVQNVISLDYMTVYHNVPSSAVSVIVRSPTEFPWNDISSQLTSASRTVHGRTKLGLLGELSSLMFSLNSGQKDNVVMHKNYAKK